MGRVAFDPDEMRSLAGQVTSAAGSLLGVQAQVVAAANDPGLLPSGVALAAQAEAAVAGLIGVQNSLLNTAALVTATTTAYEAATAAEGAIPPLDQFLTSPLGEALPFLLDPITAPYAAGYLGYEYGPQVLDWIATQLNRAYGFLGGGVVNEMNEFATVMRETHSPLWPYMEKAHDFLGQPSVRGPLETYSTATSYLATALSVAAAGVEIAGFGPWDFPADAISGGLSIASASVSGSNMEANLLLAAGGDQRPQVKQNIGSDEVSLASFGIGKAVSSYPVAKGIFKSISWSRLAISAGTKIQKAVPPVESAAQTIWNDQQQQVKTAVEGAQNAASTVRSDVQKLNDWLRKHPGVVPNPNPAPGPHGSH